MASLNMMGSWTDEDKRLLLKSLYRYGTANLDAVQADLPHKSLDEIQRICQEYSQEARRRCHVRRKVCPKTPMKRWQDVLERLDSLRQDVVVKDLIPRMLKYIALFEPRAQSDTVNLQDCYMFLSDLSFGLLPGKIGEFDESFMKKCLESLQGNGKPLQEYLETLENVTLSNDDDAIDNPLGVPESYLQLSKKERSSLLFEDE